MSESLPSAASQLSITIRRGLQAGDIGAITQLHGKLYQQEYQYGVGFEAYVAKGLSELYQAYDPERSCIWLAELQGKLVGCIALQDRGELAQLRYFLLSPECRGKGLGKGLMQEFMTFAKEKGYAGAYLWTTEELYTAAGIYQQQGFTLTEEHLSADFGKNVKEQRYDLRF